MNRPSIVEEKECNVGITIEEVSKIEQEITQSETERARRQQVIQRYYLENERQSSVSHL